MPKISPSPDELVSIVPPPVTASETQGGFPLVSVIVPCRNEKDWIGRCLASIVENTFPKDRLEVIVVDGMSDDGTRSIVESFAAKYPFVRLVDNPRRITPTALNLGIAASRGDIIMRMDAHYKYGSDYISSLAGWLARSGADNVGGVLVMEPAGPTALSPAIAVGVCHPFGIGNAYYRIGVTMPTAVDTVPFGCYRRGVFEWVGLFDEDLARNQDIEFNLRLIKAGGKILLVPAVVVYGNARPSLRTLARAYFQYGYFNPVVIRKLGGKPHLRQAAAPLFVAALVVFTLAAPWYPAAAVALAAILCVYGSITAACCVTTAARRGLRCGAWLAVVFPVLHLSHGLGFLKGLFDFYVRRRNLHEVAEHIPLAR